MKKQQIKKAKEIKVENVEILSEKVARAKSIAFVDYHGLTVNQISQLRNRIKEVGGEMTVAKNTLVKRALLKNRLSVKNNQLTGPTATVFSYEDEVAPIKALAQNAKSSGLPKFKFGFFGSSILDVSGLENLAQIPPKEILHGNIVGVLAAPIKGIVNVLHANIRNFVIVLDQIAKKTTS